MFIIIGKSRLVMQINKIYTNNIQSPLRLESNNSQAEKLPYKNYETSIYNQKGLTIPFRGYFSSVPKNLEGECVELLRTARNGSRIKFSEQGIEQILKILKKEPCPNERYYILKEAFCLTWDETEADGEHPIDFYNIYGEPISNKFFKDYLRLVSGRDGEDRLALWNFTKYEMDNDVTEPIGDFLKLPEKKKQELIPFLRRIYNLSLSDCPDVDNENSTLINDLYSHFRLLVYAITDISQARDNLEKHNIKALLIESSIENKAFEKEEFSDEATRETVLNLIADMNKYIVEKIL